MISTLKPNQLWARLVDGRAIHFFIQFVEPILNIQHQIQSEKLLGSIPLDGSLQQLISVPSPIARALVSHIQSPNKQEAMINFFDLLPSCLMDTGYASAPYVGITRFQYNEQLSDTGIWFIPTSNLVISHIKEALDLLDIVGLRFFVELSTGFFIQLDSNHSESDNPFNPNVVYFVDSLNTIDRAHHILERSARNWYQLWMSVEALEQSDSTAHEKLNSFESQQLTTIFSQSVLCEYYRRILETNIINIQDKPYYEKRLLHEIKQLEAIKPVLPSLLDTFPGWPLCKELICCWYPCWDRFEFILGSPFDHRSNLPVTIEPLRR